MDSIINLRLLMHPMNWAIVFMVLLFVAFAAAEIHSGMLGGCGCSSPANPD